MPTYRIEGYGIDCYNCGPYPSGGPPQKFTHTVTYSGQLTIVNASHFACPQCPSQRVMAGGSYVGQDEYYPGSVRIFNLDGYDCINGECLSSGQYGTPGKYSSLADCQAVCGGGTPCDGVCISHEEANQINGLISSIQGKL